MALLLRPPEKSPPKSSSCSASAIASLRQKTVVEIRRLTNPWLICMEVSHLRGGPSLLGRTFSNHPTRLSNTGRHQNQCPLASLPLTIISHLHLNTMLNPNRHGRSESLDPQPTFFFLRHAAKSAIKNIELNPSQCSLQAGNRGLNG